MSKKKTAKKTAAPEARHEAAPAKAEPRANRRQRGSVLERKPKLKCLRHREAAEKAGQ
jgi:hypothetical protein